VVIDAKGKVTPECIHRFGVVGPTNAKRSKQTKLTNFLTKLPEKINKIPNTGTACTADKKKKRKDDSMNSEKESSIQNHTHVVVQ